MSVTTSSRFARELSRAVAARGKLPREYQQLSDHWTLVLQRLWPVWAVLGPGVANPGHIEITSRTVYLDAEELLGTREQIVSGRLDPRRILATFGVGIHEVMHAVHSKPWIADRDQELAESDVEKLQQLAVDRQLLEEPRMEATGVRTFPEDTKRARFIRRALGAAVVDVILPRLNEAIMMEALATGAVSRDLCGRTMVYAGRTHYGVLDPARLGRLPAIWKQVLGGDDVERVNNLLARVIWVPDGDNEELTRYAELYRDVIGPPPPLPRNTGGLRDGDGVSRGEESADGEDTGGSSGTDDGEGGSGAEPGEASDGTDAGGRTGDDKDGNGAGGSKSAGGSRPTPQSLGEALMQAVDEQREGQLAQLNEDIDLQKLLKSASKPEPAKQHGRGTGTPSGRFPNRGVDRPPFPDEVKMAQQFARRLHQARDVGLKRISKQTPGGKFNPRGHVRGHAQRQLGVPVTAKPWQLTRIAHAPIREPAVALIIDTSSSMAVYEGSLGPIAWVLSEGLREFNGRLTVALFGNSVGLLSDGRQPLRLVPGIRTAGGTAFASDALSLCAEAFESEWADPRRPKFAFCVSDGAWADTEAGVKKIKELREERDVPVIHIAIGCPPLAIEASAVVTVTDPDAAFDLIAQEVVDALKARRRF